MAGMLRVPRSRGAFSGVLLILLGAWGALVPFVGPYFHYAYSPDTAWSFNADRLWLEVLPGIAAVLGGIILLVSAVRPVAMFGAWLGALGGAWFAVGTVVSPVWTHGAAAGGAPVGGTIQQVIEQIGFFTGLGVVMVFVAALAIGRLSVVGVRDARLAEARREPDDEGIVTGEPARTRGAAGNSPDGNSPDGSMGATETWSRPSQPGR